MHPRLNWCFDLYEGSFSIAANKNVFNIDFRNEWISSKDSFNFTSIGRKFNDAKLWIIEIVINILFFLSRKRVWAMMEKNSWLKIRHHKNYKSHNFFLHIHWYDAYLSTYYIRHKTHTQNEKMHRATQIQNIFFCSLCHSYIFLCYILSAVSRLFVVFFFPFFFFFIIY